ncbi:hypothetical protein V6N13_030687 [Hibiscus sabdariffa]
MSSMANSYFQRCSPQSDCESVSHLVKGCFFAKQVLSELGIFTCPWLPEQSFVSWLFSAFDSLNYIARHTFVVALWAIWGSWNKIIHKKLVQPVREPFRLGPLESPPPVDRVKVNFDACFDPTRLHSISGITFRNSEGHLLAARTIPNPYVMNPEMAEAIAYDKALILSKELGFKNIEVEGDALLVISKVVNPMNDRSTLGAVYANILKK